MTEATQETHIWSVRSSAAAWIVQVVAQSGLSVVLVDVSQKALGAALKRTSRSLAPLVKAGRLDETAATAARARRSVTTDLKPLAPGLTTSSRLWSRTSPSSRRCSGA